MTDKSNNKPTVADDTKSYVNKRVGPNNVREPRVRDETNDDGCFALAQSIAVSRRRIRLGPLATIRNSNGSILPRRGIGELSAGVRHAHGRVGREVRGRSNIVVDSPEVTAKNPEPWARTVWRTEYSSSQKRPWTSQRSCRTRTTIRGKKNAASRPGRTRDFRKRHSLLKKAREPVKRPYR